MLEKIGEILESIGEFISDHSEMIMGVVVLLIIGGLLVGLLAAGVDLTRNDIGDGEIINKWVSDGRTFFTIHGKKNGLPYNDTFEVTEDEYAAYKIGDWYER